MNSLLIPKNHWHILLAMLVSQVAIAQEISINEFMSDNETYLQDSEGDYSDWIELYNNESFAIDLVGYSLSDNVDTQNGWSFPSVTIPANGFLLLFASDKNTIINGEVHTSFKISSDGEPLTLLNNAGEVIDQIAATPLNADRCFGRLTDGSDILVELNIPTAGTTNANSFSVLCSHASGWYVDTVAVSFISSNSGTEIRYTLNGNPPNASSPIAPQSLVLTNVTDQPNSISDNICYLCYIWF